MTKRLVILLMLVASPLIIGLLFTYDVIKIEWISFMEIQPSYSSQEDPLPMPARSVPIQGAAYIAELGAPVNPVPADEVSLERGKQLYEISCQACHGVQGQGNGPFSAFLQNRPANLLEGNSRNNSDGAMYVVISNGISGKMPHLRENLPTARDRWDVVNYVRDLQKKTQ